MAAPFSFSPLFQMASREIRAQARAEWAGSAVGRLVREVRRGFSTGDPAALITGALQRYGRNLDPHQAIDDLMGVDFRSFTRGIERYARSDSLGRTLVREFLRSMGPAGSLIWSLVGGGGAEPGQPKRSRLNEDIDSAIRFLEAFGFEVLPPRGKRRAKVADVDEATRKAVEFLQQVGYPIGGERTTEEEGEIPQRQGLPFGISPTVHGRPRKSITLGETLSGGRRRYPVDHPIVTGDMVDADSSNVHSFGYDLEEKVLYVRFLAAEAKKGLRQNQRPPHLPGPLYRYRNVPEDLFLSMIDAPSKGSWIWEHIRIEGTVSGHMYPYDLVGVVGGYVPRKAEFGEYHAIVSGKTPRDVTQREYGEFYIPRRIWTTKGRALESERPLELVAGFTPTTQRVEHVMGPDKVIKPRRPHG